jgi:hypothetical protein
MKGDYYKRWYRINNTTFPTLELWTGLTVWILILVFAIWGFFSISHWYMLLVGFSMFSICFHWGRLIISQRFYKRNYYYRKEEEKRKQEAYKCAIVELKEIHKELTDFLKKGEEAQHRDMKEVSPGIWIHKDYKNLSECIRELSKMIPPMDTED